MRDTAVLSDWSNTMYETEIVTIKAINVCMRAHLCVWRRERENASLTW